MFRHHRVHNSATLRTAERHSRRGLSAPDGTIKAFAGGFERLGATTPYRFISTDRDVYFNGIGPMRQYMIQVGQGEDAYADVQYGNGVLPALDGYRWKIVNKQTGQVMQVVGGGTNNGALVNTAADTGALYQRWNLVRDKDGYYALFNANSGLTADVFNGSLGNGGSVDQWGSADNLIQHWYIDPATNGYYYIRNGNSNLSMTGSSNNNIQYTNLGSAAQQWQFVLDNPTSPAKANYQFERNVTDNTGAYNATAFGSPTYSTSPTGQGQAINFNGTSNYVQMPSGVANSSDITITAQVKWNGGSTWQRIFDLGTGTTSYMFLTPQSGSNTMRFAITTAGNANEQILDTDALPTGQWVTLTLTLGGNTGVLYINGKPQVAGQILLNPSDINPTLNYIGKSQFSDPLFNGSIDNFRIYDYALDPSQVLSLAYTRWSGAVNSNWTTATLASPKNWQFDVASTDYANGNNVVFDDYASAFTVNVTDATVTPSSTQFYNTTHDYILNGPGSIAGTGALTKNGTGAVTINNSNTYTGTTTVNGGTLTINGAINNSQLSDLLTNAGATTNINGTVNARFVDTLGGTVNIFTGATVTDTGSQFSDGATGNVSGGSFSINGELWIGQSGTGTLNQSGGTISSSSYFVIGRSGNGIYNLTGGTILPATNGGFTTLGSFGGANGYTQCLGWQPDHQQTALHW